MRNRYLAACGSLFSVVACGAVLAASDGQTGAKALFYDPASGVALTGAQKAPVAPGKTVPVRKIAAKEQAKYVGVHYWLELDGKGAVSDKNTFHTGDRIRVHVRSNVDGYLTLWTMESNGEGKLLLPQPGKDTLIVADSEYITPGFIKFAEPVQDERLLVFFSRSKTDLPTGSNVSRSAQQVSSATGTSGAKSLVLETDDKDQGEIGTYVVNRDGGPVAKEITLHHQTKVGTNQ